MLGFGIPNTVSVEKAFQNVSQLFGMIENFFIRLLISGQFFVCILSFRILTLIFPNFECPIKKSRNSFFKIAAGKITAVLLVGLRGLRFF